MPHALDTSNLPAVLSMVLWPWIDAVEVADSDMADTLRKVSEKAAKDLCRMIVVTPPLETTLRDALEASEFLARGIVEQAFAASNARLDALVALNGLIAWLRGAKPSEWAKSVGIRW